MEINKKLKLATALVASIGVSACSTTGGNVSFNGSPIGASTQVTANVENCITTTQRSINLLLIGGSASTNAYDEQCARNHIVRLLLTADLSHDANADADVKAVALMIAGMENSNVQEAIDNVAQGATPGTRRLIQQRVDTYRASLRQQGREELLAELGPEIQALREEIVAANQFYVSIVKPEACSNDHYVAVEADMNIAYPHAVVQVKDASWTEMGITFNPNDPAAETAQEQLCFGAYMQVVAQQGVGTIPVSQTFYQDQSQFDPASGEDRPVFAPQVAVAAVAQRFPISAEYQQVLGQRIAAEQEALAHAQAEATAQAEAERLAAAQAEENNAPEVEQTEVAVATTTGTQTTTAEATDPNSCSIVRASFNKIRSYAVGDETVTFELNQGDVDHFRCPNASGDGFRTLYAATSFQSVNGSQPVQVLSNGDKVNDRPNGIMASMASFVMQ